MLFFFVCFVCFFIGVKGFVLRCITALHKDRKSVIKEKINRTTFQFFINNLNLRGHNANSLLKVNKSRKQNTKFAHPQKNQQNFVHFFALASKSGAIKKIKALYWIR